MRYILNQELNSKWTSPTTERKKKIREEVNPNMVISCSTAEITQKAIGLWICVLPLREIIVFINALESFSTRYFVPKESKLDHKIAIRQPCGEMQPPNWATNWNQDSENQALKGKFLRGLENTVRILAMKQPVPVYSREQRQPHNSCGKKGD